MKRRSFLGGLLAAPLAALVAKKAQALPLKPEPPQVTFKVPEQLDSPYAMGARAFDANGGEFLWWRMPRDVRAGEIVEMNNGMVGVSTAALRAGEAGWLQIYGMALVETGAVWVHYDQTWPVGAPKRRTRVGKKKGGGRRGY